MDKPNQNIEIKEVPNMGKGLFAAADIKPKTFIIEYTGEVFHRQSKIFKKRETVYLKSTNTYTYQLDQNYIIDAQQYGNWARFINHSHDPNCEPH